MSAARLTKIKAVKTETDIAVLQVQVKNLDEKFDGLKDDIHGLRTLIDTQNNHTTALLETMQKSSAAAHEALNKKIGDIERWKWMVMGGATVAGALGFHLVSKIFGV